MATTVEAPAREDLDEKQWFALPADEVAEELQVDTNRGLSTGEAAERMERYGPNRFAAAATEPRWRAFARQYRDLMQMVLLVAGILSLYPLKELGTGLMLLLLTVLNALMGLHQEGKAAEAISALQKMMIVKARVLRDGALAELPAQDLVPGDVVSIEAGDLVPADGRLLQAATLEVDESPLTGESLPVAKGVETLPRPDTVLGDRTDMVYMNTSVTRGAGEFVVTATGMATEVGHISGMLQAQEEVETPLTRQLAKLTNQILLIAGVAVMLSIALNLSRGETFNAVVIAAVAFAVAAIPTGLPAVVTAILSGGTQALARANAIVKRLRSAETLGCTSAINSDKTGTLTLNQMTAVELTIPGRRYAIDGNGYSTEGRIKHEAGQPEVPLEPFLLPMALCADAVVQQGELIGDPTEGALVVLAEKGGLDVVRTRERHPRVAELPFDAAYKLMATFHQMQDEEGNEVVRAFVKGAPDQLLARGGATFAPDLTPMVVDEGFRERYLAENERLARQGMRVMATARKDFDPASFDPDADLLPLMDGLTLLALVGIVDPPRPAARTSITTAKRAGIQVRMITGDHAVTAEAIARDLGIDGRAITGAEFGAMDDEELREQIDGIGVIARVTPEHKVRLVETLKANGRIVAMTGDGVNDAPALKTADIGIAMGITGTEVSKEAAAMILTDDDFSTIVKAVELGRALYDSLKKYIRFQMGCLTGFVVTFLGGSIANIVGGVAFLPLQALYINFSTQAAQSIGLGYGKPEEGLMERTPRPPDERILPRSLLRWLVIAGAIMGLATLGLVWWANDAHGTAFARTMGFTSFAIANLLFSLTAKSDTRSVFSLDTFDDRRFLIASGISILAIVVGTETRLFQRFLDTQHLDGKQWLLCIGVALPVVIASEIRKWILRRKEAQQSASAGTRAISTNAA